MMLLDFSRKLKPLTPEETYQVFVNALDLRSGFGIFFLQCSPGETNRLIPRVQQDLPGRNIEVLELVEPIDNLYKLVAGRADRASLNILFIRGLERSLESDIKPGYKGLGDYYNLNTVPPILSHLNQQRENFRDHFGNICFIFVLPTFAIRYFVRRAPDFFDWNSGVFKIEGTYSKEMPYPLQFSDLSLIGSKQQILEEGIESYHETQAGINPDRYQDWDKQGDFLYNSGRYEEAIAFYDRVVTIKPNDHQAWYKRGDALVKLGRYEESINSFDCALTIKPDDYQYWCNRGFCLSNLGEYEKAITSYNRAIKINPNLYKAWYNCGISLAGLGKDEEAVTSYERAVAIKPDLHEAWNNQGNSLANLGRDEEAVISYERAVKIKPDKYAAWYNCGISLANLGRNEEALTSYERAVEIKPDLAEAWHNKGCSYHMLGKYSESINCFDRAITIKSDKYDSWHGKGFVQFMTSDYVATLATWQQSFKYISDSTVPRYKEDISELIQEFIKELIPRFTQPPIQQTLLIPLLTIYKESNVITELGAALVNTLHLIVSPTISDHTAAEWLSLWRTSSLGNEPAMELPFRLMSTAIEYKKDPSKRQCLWLNLPSEERPILDKALKIQCTV